MIWQLTPIRDPPTGVSSDSVAEVTEERLLDIYSSGGIPNPAGDEAPGRVVLELEDGDQSRGESEVGDEVVEGRFQEGAGLLSWQFCCDEFCQQCSRRKGGSLTSCGVSPGPKTSAVSLTGISKASTDGWAAEIEGG